MRRPLRVLLLTTSFPHHPEHEQSPFILRLAEALNKRNIHVDVICPRYPKTKRSENWNGIKIHRFQYWFTRKGQKLTAGGGIPSSLKSSLLAKIQLPFFLLAFYLKARQRSKYCDLIHAQWSLSALIASHINKPSILTERGASLNMASKNSFMKKILIKALKSCNIITANNEEQASALSKLGFKALAIPNGIDTDMFKPANKTQIKKLLGLPNKKIILFIGWLIERKGLKYLINAMTKHRDKHLIVIGDGILRKQHIQHTRKLNLNNITFLGNKKPSEIPLYLNAADLLVLPSLSEGRPNVVGEALASGLPVIATDVNGTREFLDNKNGILIPPKNSAAIDEAISNLLKPNTYKKIKAQTRKSILKKDLSWDSCAQRYEYIYHKIIR